MSLTDELTKLEELRRSGALSEAEFAKAKALLLNAPSLSEQALASHLATPGDKVHVEKELAHLDREWELEREQCMTKFRCRRVVSRPRLVAADPSAASAQPATGLTLSYAESSAKAAESAGEGRGRRSRIRAWLR